MTLYVQFIFNQAKEKKDFEKQGWIVNFDEIENLMKNIILSLIIKISMHCYF